MVRALPNRLQGEVAVTYCELKLAFYRGEEHALEPLLDFLEEQGLMEYADRAKLACFYIGCLDDRDFHAAEYEETLRHLLERRK
jgi:hypothetical protein